MVSLTFPFSFVFFDIIAWENASVQRENVRYFFPFVDNEQSLFLRSDGQGRWTHEQTRKSPATTKHNALHKRASFPRSLLLCSPHSLRSRSWNMNDVKCPEDPVLCPRPWKGNNNKKRGICRVNYYPNLDDLMNKLMSYAHPGTRTKRPHPLPVKLVTMETTDKIRTWKANTKKIE